MASQPPRDIVSVSIRLGQPMDAAKFAAAIEELGQRLLRLKGTVLFSDGPRWCDLSAGRLSQRPAEPGSRTEFTAIAFGAEKLELMLRFQSCVASAQ
jgi:G3E family GTPase